MAIRNLHDVNDPSSVAVPGGSDRKGSVDRVLLGHSDELKAKRSPFDIEEIIGDSTAMMGSSKRFKAKRAEHDQADALLDEALRMTFPASDPVAISFEDVSEGGKAASPAVSGPKSTSNPAERSAGFERKK